MIKEATQPAFIKPVQVVGYLRGMQPVPRISWETLSGLKVFDLVLRHAANEVRHGHIHVRIGEEIMCVD
ncbi:hypothetical protein [Brevundimonas sp.]|uniref:hypothetical protein n=1 Tax=Brevundimonas sp. TaxID=1871086 RepID=UPI0025FF4143|nr:hypothetical protein [Brevundimonas sp.]